MPNRARITNLEEFTRLDQDGWTDKQLAAHYGCSVDTIQRTRARLGLTRRPRLDAERKHRIQQHIDDGWSHIEIARTEHINPETLRRHFPGTAWTKPQVMRHAITTSYYARQKGVRI